MKKLFVLILLILFLSCISSETVELLALRNKDLVSGNFFLGCGEIKGNPVFKFLYKEPGGAIKLDYIRTQWATIYEINNGETPKAVFRKVLGDISRIYFYIPTGSINYEYKVDLNE